MTNFAIVLCLLFCLPLARPNIVNDGIGGLFKVGEVLGDVVVKTKGAVEEVAVTSLSSQCSLVKNILQLSYDNYNGDDEPDYSQLSLNYISVDGNTTRFNLSTSGAELMELMDKSQNLYIFIHGFTDDPSQTSFETVREAMFTAGFHNVLGLDASSLIRWLYLRSSTMVHFIGEQLGNTLANMLTCGLNANQIHIIGHSLGAHISGFTGKQFTNLTGQQVGRISGLDPAGPCFTDVKLNDKLQQTDAEFVDIIHTDAGVLGIKENAGHVDYYPNEGSNQVGCFFQSCSHSRAWEYFAESILNPTAFEAIKCESWDHFKKGNCDNVTSFMGYSSSPEAQGQFYLETARQSPFGLGDNGTKYTPII